MATQLFLLNTVASTHRGTNTAKLNAATAGWDPRALGLSRGSGVVASAAMATVTGATNGLEVGSTTTLPYEWISEPVAADITISGTITANIWAAENSMTANVAINVVIDILRSDLAGTIVQIVKSTNAVEAALTTRTANNFTTGMTSYTAQTLNRGDRLRIRVFGDDAGTMATGFTFNIGYNGTTAAADGDSYVTFTENLTFESAPGVVAVTIDNMGSPIDSMSIFGVGDPTPGTLTTMAQSFLSPSSAATLTQVQWRGGKQGSPTDNLVLEIQSDSGGVPSGTVVGTVQTVNGATLSTISTVLSYSCSIALSASTTYWLVARRTGARDTVNYYYWNGDTTSTYAGGQRAVRSSTWVLTAGDQLFALALSGSVPVSTLYLTDTASDVATAPTLLTNFTGADENPLSEGGNWASLNSAEPPLQRVSNIVRNSSPPSTALSYWIPANFGPDLEAYVTITTVNLIGIVVRIQGEGGANTWDGYRIHMTGSTTNISLVTNATPTTILSSSAVTWAVGDKLGVRCEGNTIQAWKQASGSSNWNLICSVVDTTYPSAGKIGLYISGTNVGADDFYAATDSNLFPQKAWTSRGSGVVSYVSSTKAGWIAPLLTAEWFTPQLQATTLTGMAVANIRALESAVAANASIGVEIARVNSDGTSPTVWAYWAMSANNTRTGELNTTETAETVNISGDDLAISDQQRLRIRLYIDDMPTTAMGASQTVTTYYNGTSGGASGDSYITFPITLAEYVPPAPHIYIPVGFATGRDY